MSLAAPLWALFYLTVPALAERGARRSRLLAALSPVVLCYASGILSGNLPGLAASPRVAEVFTIGPVLLAIPLILFPSDIEAFRAAAGKTFLAFAVASLTTIGAAVVGYRMYADALPAAADIAGMLTAVWIGGTANMTQVAIALDTPNDTFVLVNAAEIVLGSVYLLFLMTAGPRLLRWLLRPYVAHDRDAAKHGDAGPVLDVPGVGPRDVLRALAATLAAVGLSVGVAFAATGKADPLWIVLGISAAGIGGAFVPALRRLRGSYEIGQYLLLVFCVAIGSQARAADLVASVGDVFAMLSIIAAISLPLHYFGCWLLRIDADTAMITSTAAFFGPPFIGPVANALRNREIVFGGVAMGVLGNVVGTPLGLLVARWLRP